MAHCAPFLLLALACVLGTGGHRPEPEGPAAASATVSPTPAPRKIIAHEVLGATAAPDGASWCILDVRIHERAPKRDLLALWAALKAQQPTPWARFTCRIEVPGVGDWADVGDLGVWMVHPAPMAPRVDQQIPSPTTEGVEWVSEDGVHVYSSYGSLGSVVTFRFEDRTEVVCWEDERGIWGAVYDARGTRLRACLLIAATVPWLRCAGPLIDGYPAGLGEAAEREPAIDFDAFELEDAHLCTAAGMVVDIEGLFTRTTMRGEPIARLTGGTARR